MYISIELKYVFEREPLQNPFKSAQTKKNIIRARYSTETNPRSTKQKKRTPRVKRHPTSHPKHSHPKHSIRNTPMPRITRPTIRIPAPPPIQLLGRKLPNPIVSIPNHALFITLLDFLFLLGQLPPLPSPLIPLLAKSLQSISALPSG